MNLLAKPFVSFAGSYVRERSYLWTFAPYMVRKLRANVIFNGKPLMRQAPYRYRLYRCWGNPEVRKSL